MDSIAKLQPEKDGIKSRGRSIAHPRYTLQQAENMARLAFTEGPRHCDQDALAKKLKYSGSNNGAFVSLRSTASQFGLIKYEKGYVSVSEEWIEVLNSEDPTLLLQARKRAIMRPDLYSQLIDVYKDKQVPNLEKLTRELHINPRYNILKDAASAAAENFFDSAMFAGVLDSKGYIRLTDEQENHITVVEDSLIPTSLDNKPPSKDRNSNVASANPDHLPEKTKIPPIPDDLDKLEIQLSNGKKAYIFVPVPLPANEKMRLKAYIDLLLEEDPFTSSQQTKEE